MKKLILVLSLLFPVFAQATVTTTTRSVGPTQGPLTSKAITFPYLSSSDIVVTRYAHGVTTGGTVLTQCSYTCSGCSSAATHYYVLPKTNASTGTVYFCGTVTADYDIVVSRVVDYLQNTSFRTQSTFLPKSHEAAFDKLTMQVQQIQDGVAASEDTAALIAAHVAASDPHTGYPLLLGRSGGQDLSGSDTDGENLSLRSSAGSPTYGYINLYGGGGTLLFGNADGGTPTLTLDADFLIDSGHVFYATTAQTTTLRGSSSASGILYIKGTSNATQGRTVLGYGTTELVIDELNNKVGINAASYDAVLDASLDVHGNGVFSTFLNIGTTTGTQFSGYELYLAGDFGNTGAGTIGTSLTVGTSVIANDAQTAYASYYGGTTADDDVYIAGTSNADASDSFIYFGQLATQANPYLAGVEQDSGQIFGNRRFGAKTNNYTVVFPDDCNGVITVTGEYTVTLPDITAASAGCQVTVINISTDGAADVAVQPSIAGADAIYGGCVGDTTVNGATYYSLAVTSEARLNNTQATAKKGNTVTLVSDGVSAWYITSCFGIWADLAN